VNHHHVFNTSIDVPIFETQYWSDEQARKKARTLDKDELAKKAAEYAKKKAEQIENGQSWEEIVKRGEELQSIPAEELIKKVVPIEEEPLPAGWAMTRDPTTQKPYYYHKKTNKTVWEKPTEETPTE
jgi:hypothetical protein